MGVYLPYTSYDYTKMQGPSPDWYHVPSKDEWVALCGILTTTFSMAVNATTAGTYLKMPLAGYRLRSSSKVNSNNVYGYYWSFTPYITDNAYILFLGSTSLNPNTYSGRAYGCSIRCFKNSPVIPTSSWTTLYDGSSVAAGAWVFYNATDGLISVSWDWKTWYTIMDKNLWATTVYNQWDTVSDANCGYFYQRGNNYWFAHSWTVTTSSTQVDASNYWPWNYYSSSTFIKRSRSPYDWSSVQNDNLWWWITGVIPTSKLKNAYIGEYTGRLPSTYQEVEYIKSSGTQYFDTGFYPTWKSEIEIDFIRESWGDVWTFWVDSWWTYSAFSILNDRIFCYWSQYQTQNQNYYTIWTRYLMKFKNLTCTLNWVTKFTYNSNTFTSPYSAYMFAKRRNNSIECYSNTTCYSLKLWDDWTLMRDFVPCYRKSDNVIWMYDLVNDVFYTNSWSWTFTKWADVN